MKKLKLLLYGMVGCLSLVLFSFIIKDKPTLYLAGDSTVEGGWGKYLVQYFDTTRLSIQNRAASGTSSRTYYTKILHDPTWAKNGLWPGIMKDIKRGDFVMIQFGHNDDSPLSDSTRSRGSMSGTSNDSTVVYNKFLGRNQAVHTYGWYLNRMIAEAKSKGATVVVCSPIPKDKWKDGKVARINDGYGKWSKEIAEKNKTFFLDLNNLIADKYDAEGEQKVTNTYFSKDHVHTVTAGSQLNASVVHKYVQDTDALKLKQYLKQ